jgi:hypothetical protein
VVLEIKINAEIPGPSCIKLGVGFGARLGMTWFGSRYLLGRVRRETVYQSQSVSGFSERDPVKKAQELGAGAYVRKPHIREKIGIRY